MSDPDYRRHFTERLGFGLDPFQVDALDALDANVNVLVSAPTGAGKTLVANYALGRHFAAGRRSFYTTPLKALSNQKYHELGARYGSEHVGLLTGDTSINREAPIVVMTTEVLRNMLLTDSDQLATLGLVVLDEVHFLQDPFRGGVWEEVLILCPSEVIFVALSATIGNADFLGEWLTHVRGETRVITETTRPVDLHQHVALVRHGERAAELVDLICDDRLSEEAKRVDTASATSRRARVSFRGRGRPVGPPPPYRSPRRSELLALLDAEDLLPVIVFVFSRAGCDDAVQQVCREGALFTRAADRETIERLAEARVYEFSDEELRALDYGPFLEALGRGVTAHHAGMVPAFREIVEACFERNLLGCVFATETLALGVNMPARSVALERFTKYGDAGRRALSSTEYAQLTGRAGRRGLDDEGHAVVCLASDLALRDAGRVALAPPGDLRSSFRPSYNLTAGLINAFDYDTAHLVVQRSFAQFEFDHRPARRGRPLSVQMDARYHVLEELGYASDWTLNERGELLRALYHECDLLVAEALATGLFENLEPSEFAGLVSCVVYESRRNARARTGRHTPPKSRRPPDRLGRDRRAVISARVNELHLVAAQIGVIEDHYDVPHAKEPDGHFAPVIAAWTRGVSLGAVLALADAEVGPTTPGDFVRVAKQVADLAEQIARLTGLGAVSEVARAAHGALVRSVVAQTTSVHPRDDGGP